MKYQFPRAEPPELEQGVTCHILVLPIDDYFFQERASILIELEQIKISAYMRDVFQENFPGEFGHDWRRVFVLPAEKCTQDLWNNIATEYGDIFYYYKLI